MATRSKAETPSRPTYLLTWNPSDPQSWPDADEKVAQVREHGEARGHWSTGRRKEMAPGSRVFLMRQAVESRGIVGSGWIDGDVSPGAHWNAEKRAAGVTAFYVPIRWDELSESPLLSREALIDATGEQRLWDTQSGGVEIPPKIAVVLEREWDFARSMVHTGEPPPTEGAWAEPVVVSEGPPRITVQHTATPWRLPVDAFVIPAGGSGSFVGGRFWEALKPDLLPEVAARLVEEFRSRRQPGFGPQHPILVALPEGGAPSLQARFMIAATAYGPAATLEHVATAALAVAKLSAEAGAERIALPIFGTGSRAFSGAEAAERIYEALVDAGTAIPLAEITLTSPAARVLESLRKRVESATKVSVADSTASVLSSAVLRGDATLEEVARGSRTLEAGERGEPVRRVQRALIARGYDVGRFGADGVLGPQTLEVLRRFQTDRGSDTPSGVVDAETLRWLDESDGERQAGGVPEEWGSPERALYTDDQLTLKDSLKIEQQVDCFAKLMVADDVHPPLSLGLFGNWGSGKTYFMELLHRHVDQLTREARVGSSYVRRVAQIRFNAWHYVDANLWATLAVRIFEGVADAIRQTLGEEEDAEDVRTKLKRRIRSSREARMGAARRRDQARTDRLEAAHQLARLKATQASTRRSYGEVRLKRVVAALKDPERFKRATDLAKSLGLAKGVETVEDVVELGERFKAIDGRVQGLLAALGSRFADRRTASLSVLVILLFVLGSVLLVPALDWIRGLVGVQQGLSDLSAALLKVLALGTAAMGWAGKQLAAVSTAVSHLETVRAELEALHPRKGATDEERRLHRHLEQLDARIQGAEDDIEKADEEIAEAEAELRRIEAGGLVYDFASARMRDPQYVRELGLISTIRRDFERLGLLLSQWNRRESELVPPEASEPPGAADDDVRPVERIILYIDDLDRCHPDRVVEVLQAVHLLLALDLFVVIVAVDARWLERSLYKAYLPEAVAREAALGRRVGSEEFSPQNYLEKIFQIPFSLPNMSEDGFRELVDDLVVTRREHAEEEERKRKDAAEPQEGGASSAFPPQRSAGLEPAQAVAAVSQEPGAPVKPPPRVSPEGVAGEAGAPAAIGGTAESGPVGATTPGPEAVDGPTTLTPPSPPPTDDRSIYLEDGEQRFLQELHGFVDTPRLTKRMVNIYRLLRVNAGQEGFERFLGDADGEYRAAALLLAINLGFPFVGGRMLRVLSVGGAREVASWSEFIDIVDPASPAGEWPEWAADIVRRAQDRAEVGRMCRRVREINHGPGVPDDLSVYRRWASHVGRYSFHWHLEVGRGSS